MKKIYHGKINLILALPVFDICFQVGDDNNNADKVYRSPHFLPGYRYICNFFFTYRKLYILCFVNSNW